MIQEAIFRGGEGGGYGMKTTSRSLDASLASKSARTVAFSFFTLNSCSDLSSNSLVERKESMDKRERRKNKREIREKGEKIREKGEKIIEKRENKRERRKIKRKERS